MYNFSYSIPTIVHFGEGQIEHLAELKQSGDRVLMVYGGSSIKRIGIYDRAMEVLNAAGLTVFEMSGVQPNPRIESVREGVEICKANDIQMILAIGGGSVIDCAKVIAAGACYDGDAWDLVTNPMNITGALPIYSVLTLAATGSEMDFIAVISDMSTNDKLGTGHPLLAPKMSVLDPTYTYTVSKRQTAAGTADIMSHTLENYFTNAEGATIQAHLCEAVLKTLVQYGPVAVEEPENYDARANLMWCASLAINGILSYGSMTPWSCHPIEHELSAFYDITHGEGLAIITPEWMKLVLRKDPSKTAALATYGREVFGIQEADDAAAAQAAIEATADYLFNKLGNPSTLREVGITDKEKFEIMAEKCAPGLAYCFVPLTKEDVLEILEAAF